MSNSTLNAPRCSRCGLIAKDLIGTPPRCPVTARCEAVKKGESLGGKRLEIKRLSIDDLPEPPPPDYRGEKPPKRQASTDLVNRSPEEWELLRVLNFARVLA